MNRNLVKLGDFVRIRTGKLDANANDPEGEYPFFTCAREPLRISTYSFDCECVLIAGNGDLNVKYFNGKFDAYQRTYIIESLRHDALNVRYLYHFMDTYLEKLRHMSIGGVIKYIKLGNLTEAKLPMPPLSEQFRIAAILDQADALRVKRREALAQLDSLTQSIFIEMFGSPATNSVYWQTKPLIEVSEEINDCPHSTPVWTENGVVCLRTSNLTVGGWNWNDTRYVSESTYTERSKRGELKAGDIVLSREGTVGIAAIVTSNMQACMGQRLVQIRTSSSILKPEYLLRHLLYVLSPKRIGQVMVGSTSQHLNVKELKSLHIPVPPIDDQLKFTHRINALDSIKTAHISSLAKFEALSASLQHRAFRGEL